MIDRSLAHTNTRDPPMMDALNDMAASFNDPQTRHAAIVHLPIALSALGVLLAIISAIWASKVAALRWLAVGAYLLMAVSAWQGTESGEIAEHDITIRLSDEADEVLEHHEHKADWIPRFALGMAILLAIGAVKTPAVRHGAGALGIVGALGVAGWTGYTGHLGGALVYEHGVGTPGPGGAAALVAGEPDPRAAFFHDDVLPILTANCMRCHKPSRLERVGGLDQTSIAGILRGGAGGPAVVPGDPDRSLLIRAARHEIEDLEMPPDADKLADDQIAILAKWIADGAAWPPAPMEPADGHGDEDGHDDSDDGHAEGGAPE
jgi:uncharacterized membrane protein